MYIHTHRFILSIILFYFSYSHASSTEDAYLRVPQLITKYGYPVETHYVTTSDGYILGIHRIPHGKNNNTISDKAVLVYHGIFCSSANFVTSKEKSLAFTLADEGYDVWLGNARGNRESRNHTTLNPDKDSKFWDFSFHEIGVIDLPQVIDYVLKITTQSRLYYIGYSQGGTIFYILMSTYPKYNSKIKAHIQLAPGSYGNATKVPFIHLASRHIKVIEKILPKELFHYYKLIVIVVEEFCQIFPEICIAIIFFICGPSDQMDKTILPNILGNLPTSSSARQLLHYMQLVNSGKFQQYDFDENNLKLYGTEKPPSYNLSVITSSGFVFTSKSDHIVPWQGVEQSCEEMGNACIDKFMLENYNHIDYMYGKKSPDLHLKLIKLLQQF